MNWFTCTREQLEVRMMLVNMAYVDLGLVPPAHYSQEVPGSLDSCLSTLSDEQRRKACRKFRKIVRQSKRKNDRKMGFYTKQRTVRYKIEQSIFVEPQDNDE